MLFRVIGLMQGRIQGRCVGCGRTPLLDDGRVYYGKFLRHEIKLFSDINVFHQSFLGREACGGGKNHTRACFVYHQYYRFDTIKKRTPSLKKLDPPCYVLIAKRIVTIYRPKVGQTNQNLISRDF
jgi:hypothetical protein